MDLDEKLVNFGVDKKGTKQDTKEDFIVMVIDRSGSMADILSDAQGGINTFINEQKKVGKSKLTICQFDYSYEKVYDAIDINEFESYQLVPRGSTALYDAIGFTSGDVKNIEVDGSKIFVIVTDGKENASKEWRSKDKVAQVIEEMKELGWDIVFLAADQESMDDAKYIGIDAGSTFMYAKSGEGSADSYRALTAYSTSMRTTGNKAQAVAELDEIIKTSNTLSKTE